MASPRISDLEARRLGSLSKIVFAINPTAYPEVPTTLVQNLTLRGAEVVRSLTLPCAPLKSTIIVTDNVTEGGLAYFRSRSGVPDNQTALITMGNLGQLVNLCDLQAMTLRSLGRRDLPTGMPISDEAMLVLRSSGLESPTTAAFRRRLLARDPFFRRKRWCYDWCQEDTLLEYDWPMAEAEDSMLFDPPPPHSQYSYAHSPARAPPIPPILPSISAPPIAGPVAQPLPPLQAAPAPTPYTYPPVQPIARDPFAPVAIAAARVYQQTYGRTITPRIVKLNPADPFSPCMIPYSRLINHLIPVPYHCTIPSQPAGTAALPIPAPVAAASIPVPAPSAPIIIPAPMALAPAPAALAPVPVPEPTFPSALIPIIAPASATGVYYNLKKRDIDGIKDTLPVQTDEDEEAAVNGLLGVDTSGPSSYTIPTGGAATIPHPAPANRPRPPLVPLNPNSAAARRAAARPSAAQRLMKQTWTHAQEYGRQYR